MTTSHSVTQWIEGLRSGDSAAVAAVWDRLSPSLQLAAGRVLGGYRVRTVSGEDVVGIAFLNCLNRLQNGGYEEISNRLMLSALFQTAVKRHAKDEAAKEFAEKRGGGRVRGESAFKGKPGETTPGFDQINDGMATPDSVLETTELFVQGIEQLGDDERTAAILKVDGYSNREIATELDCSVPTVERKLRRIREVFSALFLASNEGDGKR